MASSPPDATLIEMLATLALGVLLVACANVGGLLASRAPARAREMALRLAIGAGRARLVRQLITESLLVALSGGALGLGIGYAGMILFRQIEIPTDLPIQIAFQLDRRAVVFSVIVAGASALLFGLLPALQAARTDLTAVMKAGDAVAPGRRRRWGRAVLVGGQVAVSVVLLVVALFIYRGFRHQLLAGPGYRVDHLLLTSVDPTLVRYDDAETQRFYDQLLEQTRELPGVTGVALASTVPMQGDNLGSDDVAPEGYTFPVGKDHATVASARVDESYFDTLGLSIVRGRAFRQTDGAGAPKVAIVNEEFARHYWPDQDALGKRLRLEDKTWAEVVGVAKMSKYIFIAEPPTEFLYLPFRQQKVGRMVLIAGSAGDPTSLVGPVRTAIHALDQNMPIFNLRTMQEFYRMRAVSIFNVLVGTVGAMGAMGLGLAIVGLYGLIAYAVSRRTREIGIRMAIGADRLAVLKMVLRQGLVLSVVGLIVGLAAAVGVGELLRATFPMGGNERDLAAFVIVTPLVLAVTALAVYVPARRASRVNPMDALRYE
jgi:predicted permease